MDSHTADRLQELRDLIRQGNYRVDAGAVAEAIIHRLVTGPDVGSEPVLAVRAATCRPARARTTSRAAQAERAGEALVAVAG